MTTVAPLGALAILLAVACGQPDSGTPESADAEPAMAAEDGGEAEGEAGEEHAREGGEGEHGEGGEHGGGGEHHEGGEHGEGGEEGEESGEYIGRTQTGTPRGAGSGLRSHSTRSATPSRAPSKTPSTLRFAPLGWRSTYRATQNSDRPSLRILARENRFPWNCPLAARASRAGPRTPSPPPATPVEAVAGDRSTVYSSAFFALLAQLVEHPTLNRQVRGSSPWRGTHGR